MFHILTCLEKPGNEMIENVLKDFLIVNDEMDVTLDCFTTPGRLIKQLELIHGGENYLVIAGDFTSNEYTLDLLNIIRHKLRYCYILFASRDVRLLYTAVNQNTRISGFVRTPLIDSTLLRLIRQIYDDYLERNRDFSDKTLEVHISRNVTDSRERVLMRIPFDEIYFIEASNRKIRHVMRNTVYSDNSTLSDKEAVLDRRFIRCHNAFIINAEKIRSINYGKNEITLKSGDIIPISRAKKKLLKQALTELNITYDSL